MAHRCHANGCSQDDAHPELPFCKKHFRLLPEAMQKRLWSGRRRDGLCGACDPKLADEVRLRAHKDWNDLFNLAVAMILTIEYGSCGAPESFHDETGFCWGCGVNNAPATYDKAAKLLEKTA